MQGILERIYARRVNRALQKSIAGINAATAHLNSMPKPGATPSTDPVLVVLPDYARRSLWRSYVVVGRGLISLLGHSLMTVTGWLAIVPSLFVLFSKPIAERFTSNWEGLDARFAVVPIIILIVHLAIKKFHDSFEDIKQDAHNTKKKLGDIDLRLRIRTLLRNGKDMAEYLNRHADVCTPAQIELAGKTIQEWGVTVAVHLSTADVYRRHFMRKDLMLYREGGDNRIRDMVRFVESRLEALAEVISELERL